MVPEPVTLTVLCDIWTQNRNDRLHWSDRAALVGQARGLAKMQAISARLGSLGPCRIEATPLQARRPLADPGAHFPAVKAVIDGLVDAGVLDGDTAHDVHRLVMHPPLVTPARAVGIALVLHPAALQV